MSALIYCPFPDRDSARVAANELLDRKLIACANIIGDVEAIYEWEGERGTSAEVGVLFKTAEALLNESVGCLARIHPYDTPAIMGWRCDDVSDSARDWLNGLTRGN